tara:strand:+ start:692 stop:1579 length:888 start_codon:yes stop_codon:yes gene_type:complete
MKIIDCTTYFEEDLMMDIRFNTLNEYVDEFIVCEANYSHSGKKKKINFQISNFPKFKDKITHIVSDKEPLDLEDESSEEPHIQRINSIKRINHQRDYISNNLEKFNDEDIIMYSDNDEIPNLKEINFKKIKEKIILFKQKTFYYKLNLQHPLLDWYGTKCCKKKYLKNMTWLRSIKNKKYNIFRFDVLFSDLKFMNLNIINNGGWHFTNLKTPEDLLKKYQNDEMHSEFKLRKMGLNDIKRLVKEQVVNYNHFIDSSKSNQEKHSKEFQLQKININLLPEYIIQNSSKFKQWIIE